MKKMTQLSETERDEVTFFVIDRFIATVKPVDIAALVKEQFGVHISREQVYPLLAAAARRGYLSLTPPAHRALADRIRNLRNAQKRSVEVINAPPHPGISEHLASRGALVVLDLIRERARARKGESIHIGLGIGRTTMRLARCLALHLRSERGLPKIVVHALTPAGSVENAHENPLASFTYFYDALIDVEFVGLFAEPVVPSGDYENVCSHPVVRESFSKRSQIDIVVSSLASGSDEHGSLTRYLRQWKSEKKSKSQPKWAGDVQLRAYSSDAPIDSTGDDKAVTLFELRELVEFAQQDDKYVVLLCGPCGKCAELKTDALLPLLLQPKLSLWTHLVVDRATAADVLDRILANAS